MDQILKSLLDKTWGKNFISTVFAGTLLAMGALGWECLRLADQLQDCNDYRVKAEQDFSRERERILREYIGTYNSMLQRVETMEQKLKEKK